MKTRTGLIVAAAMCAAVAVAPATAGAQEPSDLTQVVSLSGKSKSGKQFRGRYAIDRFRALARGALVAVGTVRGRLSGRRVVERG